MAKYFYEVEKSIKEAIDAGDRMAAMAQAIGALQAVAKNPHIYTEPERRDLVEIINRVIFSEGIENA